MEVTLAGMVTLVRVKTASSSGLKRTIGVRADARHCEARAAELKVTASELVADYVARGLREEATQEFLFTILGELRRDLVIMTEALLSRADAVEPKEAREWVRKNMDAV